MTHNGESKDSDEMQRAAAYLKKSRIYSETQTNNQVVKQVKQMVKADCEFNVKERHDFAQF